MKPGQARLTLLLALYATSCARTQDIYVGGDLAAQAQDGAQGGRGSDPASASAPGELPSGGGAAPPLPSEPEGDESGDDESGDDDAQPDASSPSEDELPAPASCPAGQADCDGDAGNGCETMLASDPQHCGACGAACETPDCTCEDGRQVLVCPSGRDDCDGDAANGCEADLQSDRAHCGACDRACHADGARAASANCSAGRCELACQPQNLFGDCDGNPDNGCETDLFHDVANCGGCGMRCTACLDGICL